MLLRGPEDRKALRCRLPGPPMAFAAQRVREEAEDAEKVGVPNGLRRKGGTKMEVIFSMRYGGSILVHPES